MTHPDLENLGPASYERAARAAGALSSPPRLRLMNLLAQAPRGVDELATLMKQSIATTSAQLKVLKEAGLVTARAQGQRHIHEVANLAALQLFRSHRDFSLEAPDIVHAVVALEPRSPTFDVDLSALLSTLARARRTIVDLRPEEEFRHAHPKGAINIPFEHLDDRIRDLKKSGKYAVFCRGPVCRRAIDGTTRMRASGLNAIRIRAGMVDWRLAGLPLGEAA